ncbi:beta-ketoacyl-[acyl-carrier-protein] synthase family protein [Chrysiogenes arsenatis]|uniref:beta-ketoacyl-[acyl-carrier-protein] synthase family protein n=1 Tax=Chrysiogenes arsenatis TaxID=309797 RepID=UPI0003F6A8C7|nr:beta-ketoacyl-[acyl-carrier-protein] synthase family protein [Chrysiogenes arsenatis]
MPLKRVVITGYGAISPFGNSVKELMTGFFEGRSAIEVDHSLTQLGGLRSFVVGKVKGIDEKQIPRKDRRSMSPMSVYALLASQEALRHAKLDISECHDGLTGVSIGSTVGSTQATQDFFQDFFTDHSLERMKSSLFFQIANHSCAANVSQALGLSGRLLAPSAACATGCLAIGHGYELITLGKQKRMLCGGADEFHPLTAGTFDMINAASTRFNHSSTMTPRPFDTDRDGVVCSEGAGILLLEELESALGRGADILAEVVGFANVCDPGSIANPDPASIESCMRLALEEAQLLPADIDYVNAHATATEWGDIAESQAIYSVFGSQVLVSSLKGHIGHSMAASGSLESIVSLEMMRSGSIIPTRNLSFPDPRCGKLAYVQRIETKSINTIVKNGFALGGVNSTLIFRRYV